MSDLLSRLRSASGRAWRTYADHAGSDAAKLLKFLIPLDTAGLVVKLAAPGLFPGLSSVTVYGIVLLCFMLWFVRQRDQARAELKAARFEYMVSAHLREGGRVWAWQRDSEAGD